VIVVRGGSTRTQPLPFVWTQYQNLDALSLDWFQASETLVGVDAVMRRLLGVVGGVRSRVGHADAGAAPSTNPQTSTAAMPRVPTVRYLDTLTPLCADDSCRLHYWCGTPDDSSDAMNPAGS
jgi:hypothetical protein